MAVVIIRDPNLQVKIQNTDARKGMRLAVAIFAL